jgi:intracellular sulfur oxidation DsrE/DsrF family protein
MSCKEREPLLHAYVDGELDLAAALALEEHLRSCAACTTAVARLNALHSALRRHVEPEPAPDTLRARLHRLYGSATAAWRPGWRWGAMLAAPGFAALALAMWLAFVMPVQAPQPLTRVVYHISSSATASAALRNLANHLNASPRAKVVVVAHNDGVDFLLRGARDEQGQPFERAVGRFLERGVEFRVCYNTLERRGLDGAAVIEAARLVPSGIAEIGRLQSEEGYAYMRL